MITKAKNKAKSKKKQRAFHLLLVTCYLILFNITFSGCRDEKEVFIPEEEKRGEPEFTSIKGFYLLNEGNMGSNKSTLDYYDCTEAIYSRNIFAAANPSVVKELGDVGNDLQIYGSKLYAVINCSNKVEVMNVETAKRIGQINIPNCRYIRFHEGYAYITSYAGPVEINPDYRQKGFVAKVDTSTLQIIEQCLVGYQPEGLEFVNNKLYVANSGGYMFPNYENTISVIDLATFTEIKRISVAVNLHKLGKDEEGNLWVNSRGDYYSIPSRLYQIDTKQDILIDSIDIPVSGFWLDGDSLFTYSTEWSHISGSNKITYGIINVKSKQVLTTNFITDGTDEKIKIPYGIMVNTLTKDIYITDAKNYVSPGTLYCFDQYGKQKWNVRTGDIPAHFALVWE